MSDSKTSAPAGTWKQVEFADLSAESLRALFDNEIPAIRIPHFFSEAECESLLKTFEGTAFNRVTESVKKGEVSIILPDDAKSSNMRYTGHVTRVGISQSEYPWDEEAKYFSQVATAQSVFDGAAKLGIDPIQRLMAAVQKSIKGHVSIAEQTADGKTKPFFCGIVRQVNGGTYPHFDWAPFHAGKPWAIAEVNAQLSWNVFLTQPLGGHTVIYERPWQPELEALRKGDKKEPYPQELLAPTACRSFVSRPMRGALVLFNSRNFHEVLATDEGSGRRVTVSSFCGRKPNGDVIFWS